MSSSEEKEMQTVFSEENNTSSENFSKEKTSSGLEENLAGMLAYLAGFITGIIFLLIEKDNQFIRYHAFQSIIVSVALITFSIILTIFTAIPIVGWIIGILSLLLSPVYIVLWVYMLIKAYQGTWFKIPFAGDMAEKQLNNMSNDSKV